MDSVVSGVAKSRTRLSDVHFHFAVPCASQALLSPLSFSARLLRDVHGVLFLLLRSHSHLCASFLPHLPPSILVMWSNLVTPFRFPPTSSPRCNRPPPASRALRVFLFLWHFILLVFSSVSSPVQRSVLSLGDLTNPLL